MDEETLGSILSASYKLTLSIGVIIGACIIGGSTVAVNYFSSPQVDSARVIPSRQGVSIMRLYKSGVDGNLIRSPTDSSKYIQLSDYLKKNFPNSSERNLERARIELLVLQTEAK